MFFRSLEATRVIFFRSIRKNVLQMQTLSCDNTKVRRKSSPMDATVLIKYIGDTEMRITVLKFAAKNQFPAKYKSEVSFTDVI